MSTAMGEVGVRIGVACGECGRDNWLPSDGYNRCPCGQCLWVERWKEGAATRLHYQQGACRPAGYRGWARETQ